ncbi:MAG: hypothetical protein Q9162_003662 [Coniocarpon cinnabarinum]
MDVEGKVGVESGSQDQQKEHDAAEAEESRRVSKQPRHMSTALWIILCLALFLSEAQSALDNTITANLQPTIISNFGDISKLSWVNVTYSLASGSTCLLWGKLYTFFNSKKVFLAGRLLFAVGSTLSAAAPTMNAFIVGRAITGCGGSLTYIGIIVIVSALTTSEEQARYFGYIGSAWGFGTIIGPLIGGAFASSVGWRWSFYFDLILASLTLPIFIFVLPSSPRGDSSSNLLRRIRRLDLVGFALFAGSVCTGIMSLSFGGATFSWSSGQVIGLLSCSGALWIFFALQQGTAIFTTRSDRLVPAHILLSLKMWNLVLSTACSIGIIFVSVYYAPLYFQFVRGESAIRSALDVLPYLATTIAAMLISGRYIGAFKHFKIWFIAGNALALAMSICLYNTTLDTSHAKVYGYLVHGGTGGGLCAMNVGPIMAMVVPTEDSANATTIFGCVDMICGAVSLAVANAIFLNRATNEIMKVLPGIDRAVVQSAIAGSGASLTAQLPRELQQAVLNAVLDGIKDVWIQLIATAVVSLILAFFMRHGWLAKKP